MKKFVFLILVIISVCTLTGLLYRYTRQEKVIETNGMEITGSNTYQKYSQNKAIPTQVVSRVATKETEIGIGFYNSYDTETCQKILNVLSNSGQSADFLYSSKDARQKQSQINQVKRQGLSVLGVWDSGSYTQLGNDNQVMNEIMQCKRVLYQAGIENPDIIYADNKEYTRQVRQQLGACQIRYAIKPVGFLDCRQLNDVDFMNQWEFGGFYFIDVKKIADDKGMKALKLFLEKSKKQNINIRGISELLIDRESIPYQYERKNQEDLKMKEHINTSKAIVGVTFRGIAEEPVMEKLRTDLKKRRIHATFYVTSNQMIHNQRLLQQLRRDGHEIAGFSMTSMATMGWQEQRQIIEKVQQTAKLTLGISLEYFISQGSQTPLRMLQAAKESSLSVCGYNKAPIREQKPTIASIKSYFWQGLRRGDVIYLPLDKTKNISECISFVLKYIRDSEYEGVTVSKLVEQEEDSQSMKNTFAYHKIDVNKANSSTQERVVEKVSVKDKVAFLTFDDWGSDTTINAILHILKEKNVRGTFFVRGNGVDDNPFLLKAIAEDGHDIGNHTYHHLVTTKLSKKKLQQEVISCHRSIVNAIGSSPTLFFRPPTMETSDKINKAILETGISYIIRGEVLSTHDYERTKDEVIDFVLKKIYPGGIITMHMSDNSCCRRALPELIDRLRKQGYRFAKLSEYL